MRLRFSIRTLFGAYAIRPGIGGLLLGTLAACQSEPATRAEKPAPRIAPPAATVPTETANDFCAPAQFPLRGLRDIDLAAAGAFLRQRPRPRLTGARWRRLNWDRFPPAAADVDYEANPPADLVPLAFQLARPNYCAFLMHQRGDDYNAVELYTLQHATGQLRRLLVAGIDGQGCGPRREGTDTLYACAGITQTHVERDTLLTLTRCYPVLLRQQYEGGTSAQPTPPHFRYDSISTRYAIRADGTFRKVGSDSTRRERDGDYWAWLRGKGWPME